MRRDNHLLGLLVCAQFVVVTIGFHGLHSCKGHGGAACGATSCCAAGIAVRARPRAHAISEAPPHLVDKDASVCVACLYMKNSMGVAQRAPCTIGAAPRVATRPTFVVSRHLRHRAASASHAPRAPPAG